jgi:hypothetical protein
MPTDLQVAGREKVMAIDPVGQILHEGKVGAGSPSLRSSAQPSLRFFGIWLTGMPAPIRELLGFIPGGKKKGDE